MTYFRLDNMHQARHMADYVFERPDLLTTFRGMTRWCRECKFYYRSEAGVRHEFRMSRPRHELPLSFLNVLSICMGKMLRNYGVDLPLPLGFDEDEY